MTTSGKLNLGHYVCVLCTCFQCSIDHFEVNSRLGIHLSSANKNTEGFPLCVEHMSTKEVGFSTFHEYCFGCM